MADANVCEVCGNHRVSTFFCSACTTTFCNDCWPKQIQHKPGKTTLDGRPHVKEDKVMIELMHSIMEPPQDRYTLQMMHQEDRDTRWFGVVKAAHGISSQFHDFNRYAQLMLDSRPLNGIVRYPKLISFIGDTNAGKSTIVKALIQLSALKFREAPATGLQTPVPGSTQNEGVPTSEGVHLYADPALLQSERPILYADCEGLNAGERPPFATEASKSDKIPTRKLQKLQPRTREIKWTKSGDPKTGTREYAVGHLYPRFLYTFSDAIVFVQKNPKQLHLTYRYLVDWAKFNLEESINQPILPHAIVVLNAVDIGSDDKRWSVDDATVSFYKDVAKAVSRDPELRKLAEMRYIDYRYEGSARKLLQCFYSEVRVIRVPAKRPERYGLIDEQMGKLRDLIIDAGDKAHHAKILTRRLNDVDTLQEYLQAGFVHFADNIDEPFDFKSVALRTRVIAQDLSDHIVNLAGTVQKCTRIKPRVLFKGLVSLVASSILLDSVRNKLPGSIVNYFPANYAPLCKAALHRFCDEHVPCDFTDRRCDECKNVKSAHVKGHQNSKGKVITGTYTSAFQAKSYEKEWNDSLQQRLSELEIEFNAQRTQKLHAPPEIRQAISDMNVAVRLHNDSLVEFFSQSSSGKQCFSNATCFGCLMATPQIALPCGHTLCKSCVAEHGDGDYSTDLAIYLKSCPLHPQETFDWEVQQKPEFAGIRVLTLDGGGIRGIVELEILRAIESRINVGSVGGRFIPVQRFFDLIVGTSTGGIVALGLTVRQWSVNDCISEFLRLCDKAFSPRELAETRFSVLATLNHGSKWRTKPLHEALQNALGSEPIFGGTAHDSGKYASKVAVVSASEADCRPLLISNYNREEPADQGHSLELPDDPKDTLRVWEAAAATSAAPSFFKAFVSRTGKTYLDGALNHNNPVYIAWREKKLIWPDVLSRHPDIFVSLGTGQHKAELDAKLKRGATSKPSREAKTKQSNVGKTTFTRATSKRYRAWEGMKNYFSVLVNKLDNILDTERAWDDFCSDVVGEHWSTEDSARYIRLNPDLQSQPPALDEKQKLGPLSEKVRGLLKSDPTLARSVEDVANRLFASSFYFRKDRLDNDGSSTICSGSLHCKFEGKPHYIEQIGLFLKNQLLRDFVPKFTVTRLLNTSDARHYDSMAKYKIPMDMHFIDSLIAKKEFDLNRILEIKVTRRDEPTYICLQLRLDDSRGKVVFKDYPISGFPRKFLVEKERSDTRMQKRKAEIGRLRSKKRGISPANGELLSTTISNGSRKSLSESSARSPTLTVPRLASPPSRMDDSLSDTDYGSDGEADKMFSRMELDGLSES